MSHIPFQIVLRAFDREHSIHFGSNAWAREALLLANKQFYGVWSYRPLTLSNIMKIVFPQHDHALQGGHFELIPKTGLTLKETLQKLYTFQNFYRRANPLCWSRIQYVSSLNFSPLFLSTRPISKIDYQGITTYSGHLFHLDGIHRLIGWGLMGKLSSFSYAHNKPLYAYIAGL